MINEVTSKFVCTICYNHAVDPKHLNHIKIIGRFLLNVRLMILSASWTDHAQMKGLKITYQF
jgi:hypothetical protein